MIDRLFLPQKNPMSANSDMGALRLPAMVRSAVLILIIVTISGPILAKKPAAWRLSKTLVVWPLSGSLPASCVLSVPYGRDYSDVGNTDSKRHQTGPAPPDNSRAQHRYLEITQLATLIGVSFQVHPLGVLAATQRRVTSSPASVVHRLPPACRC